MEKIIELELLSSVENNESVSNHFLQFLSQNLFLYYFFFVYLNKLQWSIQNNYNKLIKLISLIHHKPE